MISSRVNDWIVLFEILTGTTASRQRGPRSNGNEGTLHILKNFRTGDPPSNGLLLYSGKPFLSGRGLTPHQKVYYTAPADRVAFWLYQAIGLMSRVFANGPGDCSSIPGRVIRKTKKMVFVAALLNTQHYKVRIKDKVEQFRKWSNALPYSSV